MNLLIADDHRLFRDALVHYIARVVPKAKVAVAGDMQEVMENLAVSSAYDLVLLDLYMPGMNGFAGMEKVMSLYPALKVALMSGLAEKADVEKAMKLGAVGYFPKTLSGKAMVNGILQVVAGETFIPIDHNTNQLLASHFGEAPGLSPANREEALKKFTALTTREREVLSYLGKGMANKEIAQSLGLQVVTIKLHVRSICKKLGAANRTQAALMAKEAI